MGKIRKFVDRFLLCNYEWRKKYDPEPEWTKECWREKAERTPMVYPNIFGLDPKKKAGK